ncbi:type I-E CRISPR-associated protein Cas6/Cse3/CasE [Nocardiopsis terrae]|uniref:CRISPR system Cascade subunit CasE n=1 Tax=Nocardiopsis terrae TaxID=372655 RepID=A0ABR9HID7_9ACTN|nr:type I-E CRISPR-associated protein Cas6/Cse3/CasE [Nocardiopsis terrae]MBE1458781.1 CRISPR system Cascade subunit CasE [Nocardiopsis terrae]GHC86276.1 type I-E CRISPR-associated protein Cas6/Cse3/CasE [Nocardiopsis terrae]
MTWLTKIVPDLGSRRARSCFGSAGELHRLVIGLAAHSLGEERVESPRQRAGLLFRVEETRGAPVLLVQSSGSLNADALGAGFGSMVERDLTPFLEGLEKGTEVRYRIAAAPSKRLGKSDLNAERLGKRAERLGELAQPGKRTYTRPLFGEQAEQWWRERAQRHGLDLSDVVSSGAVPSLDQGRTGKRGVRIHVTRFDGHAVVRDPDALREAVRNGIGRGKSFGCGMLSLAPAGW